MNTITSKDGLLQECVSMQFFLDVTVSEEINEIQERGNMLSMYLARSGKMLADAKYYKDVATKKAIIENKDLGLSPMVFNELIRSTTFDENYIVNWLERINRTCTHQMDWLRSVLSKAKEDLRQSNFGNFTK